MITINNDKTLPEPFQFEGLHDSKPGRLIYLDVIVALPPILEDGLQIDIFSYKKIIGIENPHKVQFRGFRTGKPGRPMKYPIKSFVAKDICSAIHLIFARNMPIITCIMGEFEVEYYTRKEWSK